MSTASPPRRKDREVKDPEWIKGFLRKAPIGILAIADQGPPYVNSNIFVYQQESDSIYLHSSATGRLPALTATARPASFTAYTMGRVLPAARAIDFSLEYASAIAFGNVSQVEEDEEAGRALRALMTKYAPKLLPGVDYDGISDKDLSLTAVHRFRIESWVAKRNEKPDDFPGAYHYGQRDRSKGHSST